MKSPGNNTQQPAQSHSSYGTPYPAAKRSISPALLQALRKAVKRRLRKSIGRVLLHDSNFVLRVRVLLDHQNFYYNICKHYGYKWIDLVKLFERVLQDHYRKRYPLIRVRVEKLIVFGAILSGEDGENQAVYFAALSEKYRQRIDFELGKVETPTKLARLAGDKGAGFDMPVEIREEKNSDTNLVGEAVYDTHTFQLGLDTNYHLRCVVSNDGDMKKALEVMNRLGLWGAVLAPLTDWSKTVVSSSLEEQVSQKDIVRSITKQQVRNCLLPVKVGKYQCPVDWL